MPKRNYQFEKRQKDLEKKRKAELKAQRKLDRARGIPGDDTGDEDSADASSGDEPGPGTP